jgi:hypothetical protein
MLIYLGLLALVAILFVLVATRPAEFRIERSVVVGASPQAIFSLLDDFRRWPEWSPYDKGDPSAQKSYAGPPSGAGSSFHYVSKKFGEGRMTVTESRPYERVALRGEFIKPFRNTTEIEFKLTRTGDGVSVTWAMAGRNNWIFKAFSLIANMDTMVGKEFEKGLVDLKQVAEGGARSSPADAAGMANSGSALT